MRSQDPIYFAPQRKLGGGWICFKDSPSQPTPPDYPGAARATAAGSVQASIANNLQAHPDIYTPLGSQTWRQTGTQTIPGAEGNAAVDIPTYRQDVKMTPTGQGLYDQQVRLSQGVGNVAEGQLGRVADSVAQPFSLGGLPNRVSNVQGGQIQGQIGPQDLNAARDATTNAIIAREQPRMDRARAMLGTQLSNQGITQGSEAYRNAQDDQARQENDFRLGAVGAGNAEQNQLFGQSVAQGQFANQAQNMGFGQGVQNASLANEGRGAGIQEQSYLRSLPLNEMNAFRTGSQVNMPQFQPTQYSMGAQGPNMTGATQQQGQWDLGQYNSGVAQANSFNNGLFQLGGTIGGAMIKSDRRLKSNIVRIGTHPLGIGVYAYDIEGRSDIGVMADEVLTVRPDAVMRGADGFLRVNYGRL